VTEPSGIFALLKEFIEYPFSTKTSVVAALVAIGSALWSGYFAWLARSRPSPVIEIEVKQREDWPGWLQVRAIVTYPAPAALRVDQVSVRRWSRRRIVLAREVHPSEPPRNIGWLSDRFKEGEWVPPPPIPPPEVAGHRVLTLTGIREPADAKGSVMIDLVVLPRKDGTFVADLGLIFHYRYRDQLSKTKAKAAAVRVAAVIP